MANEEQLQILLQGCEVWNNWRENNPLMDIDLRNADLQGMNFSGFNLSNVNLSEANLDQAIIDWAYLNGTNLSKTQLEFVHFRRTYLRSVNLSQAKLRYANFHEARLPNANFYMADLHMTNFDEALCHNANFTEADLNGANLSNALLNECIFQKAEMSSVKFVNTNVFGADFSDAYFGDTFFTEVNLNEAKGLETTNHWQPSNISLKTINFAQGKLPEYFLKGCGLSDWEIQSAKLYNPNLSNEEINSIIYKIFDFRAQQAIQVSPLFISYSHKNTDFVEKLEKKLTDLGIRFWRDVHNATAGRLEKQIDRAMRKNPTVVLILSGSSINSDWVEHEARLAREIEKELGRDVLCPIALDDSWKTANWPQRLMEQIKEYNILDFSKWEDNKNFENVFNKMISGLDMFYKEENKK